MTRMDVRGPVVQRGAKSIFFLNEQAVQILWSAPRRMTRFQHWVEWKNHVHQFGWKWWHASRWQDIYKSAGTNEIIQFIASWTKKGW